LTNPDPHIDRHHALASLKHSQGIDLNFRQLGMVSCQLSQSCEAVYNRISIRSRKFAEAPKFSAYPAWLDFWMHQ
jgi:hypothetical protein